MPWIDDNRCDGCGTCVEECPVGVIEMQEEKARINMDGCIRCALCHDICPQEAVRHDSDKVAERIQTNVEKTKKNMEACFQYLGKAEEKQKCLQRMIKHFTRESNIAEKTVTELQKLKT
jgi:ferredoxin